MADTELVVGAFETVDNTEEEFETYIDGEDVHEEIEVHEEVDVVTEDVVTTERPHPIEIPHENFSDKARLKTVKRGARCEVRFCPNTSEKLEEWEKEQCETHDQAHKICSCPPPFQLYSFPSKRIANEARENWVKILQEDDPSKGEKWQPRSLSRICSRHFADGEPTNQNPMPTLYISKLLTDYSQIQPVNTFIYYVGETPASTNFQQDQQNGDSSKIVSFDLDGTPLNEPISTSTTLPLDRSCKEAYKMEKCPRTGRPICNWNGFRMYRDYTLDCWKNFGDKFECIIPNCHRRRFHNEAFLQIPLFSADELTKSFIGSVLYVLRKFGGCTDEHLRNLLHSPVPRLQMCRHHFPASGGTGDSAYRAICNFIANCEPSHMRPFEVLKSLEQMTEEELQDCVTVYNSFLLLRFATSDMAQLNRKEFGKESIPPAWDEDDERFTRYFELWKDDCFTDVLLICKDGRSVKAHKAYLSAISPFLREALKGHDEEEMTKVFLIDYEFEDVVNMLLFIYSGVHYNERESLGLLQDLLSDLGISIETSVDEEEVVVSGGDAVTPALKRSYSSYQIIDVVPAKTRKYDNPSKLNFSQTVDSNRACVKCSKEFENEEELLRHEFSGECETDCWSSNYMALNDRNNYWTECLRCGGTFLDQQEAKLHMMHFHPGEDVEEAIIEKFSAKCDLCDLVFDSQEVFTVHRNLHSGIAPFRCKSCTRPFITAEKLERHTEQNHPEEGAMMTCEKCSFTFEHYISYEKHVLKGCLPRPSKQVQFPCTKCKKTFPSVASRKAHIQLEHERVKTQGMLGFRCRYCDLLIIDYFEYKVHLDEHRKFPCENCGLLFVSDLNVKRHVENGWCAALRATGDLVKVEGGANGDGTESDDSEFDLYAS